MSRQTFEKLLTANDIGATGAHQAGIHVPKSRPDLIAFLPPLDPAIKNPDAWLSCIDETGEAWSFRYIYYNNSLHDLKGTRDEYRITHMTKFFRAAGAAEGHLFSISADPGEARYSVRVMQPEPLAADSASGLRIRLQGWRRVY